jgi:hypothetical protein
MMRITIEVPDDILPRIVMAGATADTSAMDRPDEPTSGDGGPMDHGGQVADPPAGQLRDTGPALDAGPAFDAGAATDGGAATDAGAATDREPARQAASLDGGAAVDIAQPAK